MLSKENKWLTSEELKSRLQDFRQRIDRVSKALEENFPHEIFIREFSEIYPPISCQTEAAVMKPIRKWMVEKFGSPIYYNLGMDPKPKLLQYLLQLDIKNDDRRWAYFGYCLYLRNNADAVLAKMYWG